MKTKALVKSVMTVFLLTATSLWGASLSSRTQRLAGAIAKAEGFYVKGSIPNRYHNPGDIRAKSRHAYPGQVGLNKHGYVIFRTNADGWSALYGQIEKIVSGESKHYTVNTSLRQMARRYATSPTWLRNVARTLFVSPEIELWEVLDVPPAIVFPVRD